MIDTTAPTTEVYPIAVKTRKEAVAEQAFEQRLRKKGKKSKKGSGDGDGDKY